MPKLPKVFEQLETLANLVPIPFYWADVNCVVVGLNRSCLDLVHNIIVQNYGDNVIGKDAFDIYTPESAQVVHEHSQIVMQTGKTLVFEEELVDLGTEETRYYISARSPLFENGSVVGIVGYIVEITDRKEKERLKIDNERHKAIEEQQEKFRKIVDQVVHDIRSPVASMQMILPSCKKLPENQRVSLNQAATRIMDIANRLLSEVEPAKHEIEDQENKNRLPALISSELLEVIAEKRFEYKHRTIDFCPYINQEGYFAFLNINSSDFKRMLSNLINNAVDAIKNKIGKIDLYLEVIDNNQVQIIVQDNGGGMPDTVKEKILNNISVTDGKTNGHGIGFSQIRDTLESSNGKLDIETSIGVGTKIILTFPQSYAPDWIAQKIELFNDDIIVILDDDESIHGAWEARFKKAAPDITRRHFEQGEEAIAFIKNLDPVTKNKVFLLTDYELLNQGLHGLNVVKQTGIGRSILVTSHHNSKEVRDLAKLHNTKILPKPLAPQIPITISKHKSESSIIFPEGQNEGYDKVDIVFVDDDIEFSNNFVRFIVAHKKTVAKYNSVSELMNNISKYLNDTAILIDNQLDKENITGIEIARQLHNMGFSRLYLFSGRDYSNDRSIPSYLKPILKTNLDYVIAMLNK